jgi:signal transduction histidine kinase
MFERLHPDRKIPGTGVGLAIVSTAMERLGGSRGVEANEPAGSRFWIELPR